MTEEAFWVKSSQNGCGALSISEDAAVHQWTREEATGSQEFPGKVWESFDLRLQWNYGKVL